MAPGDEIRGVSALAARLKDEKRLEDDPAAAPLTAARARCWVCLTLADEIRGVSAPAARLEDEKRLKNYPAAAPLTVAKARQQAVAQGLVSAEPCVAVPVKDAPTCSPLAESVWAQQRTVSPLLAAGLAGWPWMELILAHWPPEAWPGLLPVHCHGC